MRITPLILLLSFVWGQESFRPLEIDVRPRLFQDSLLQVVVQVDNHTQRNITMLEGFLIITEPNGKIIQEVRLVLLHNYEPALLPGMSVSRSKQFSYRPGAKRSYSFQVGKVSFANDYRVYTYHPAVGFFRID
jgi:hypothetical protein